MRSYEASRQLEFEVPALVRGATVTTPEGSTWRNPKAARASHRQSRLVALVALVARENAAKPAGAASHLTFATSPSTSRREILGRSSCSGRLIKFDQDSIDHQMDLNET